MSSARRSTRIGLATLGVLVGGLLFTAVPALAGTGHGFSTSFDGTGADQLEEPSGVAVNEVTPGDVGDVYVVDRGNNRVEYFNATGTYEGQFNGSAAPTGALSSPEAIAIDNDPSSPSKGDVYVTDTVHKVIDKFSASGTYLGQITKGGAGAAFSGLEGVAVDAGGELWVYQESREIDNYSDKEPNELIASRLEQAEGFFGHPGFGVDSEGDLYADHGGFHPVAKLNSGGEVIEPGEAVGGVNNVDGVAVDLSDNDVYLDAGTAITELASDGAEIQTFGTGSLTAGDGLAVDTTSGNVYVADSAANDVVVFTLGQTPPAPTTEAHPKAITTSSLTVGGELQGQETGYYFAYNTNGSCTGGEKTPLAPATGTAKESATITGLQPSKEYIYCLVAESNYGPTYGPPGAGETLGMAPEVSGESASNIHESVVKFAATINPENSKQETTYYFQYSTKAHDGTLEGTIQTAAGEDTIGAETAEGTSVETFTPKPAETFYYRVVATNETGTTYGEVEAYTKVPIVGGETATGLKLTEAMLEAKLNPDWQTTEYHFEYSASKELLEESKGIELPGGNTAGNENEFEELPVSAVITGLKSYTTYYYRLVAENPSTQNPSNADKGLPVAGEVEEFTTQSLPFTSTGEAQEITRTTAALTGTVTPPFVTATYYFQYINQTAYDEASAGDAEERSDPYAAGETTVRVTVAGSSTPQAAGPAIAGGLLPETTYVYRLVAKNEFGWEYGEPHTFTTQARVLPGVSTGAASGVSQNAATLTGTVATNGQQTDYGFQLATEPGDYGPATGLGSIGGATTQVVSVALSKLAPGMTYYYRLEATNADGAVEGQPETFTTPGFPSLISPPASPPLIATPNIAFPKEEKASGTSTKKLTNAEKLSKALKACRKDKGKAKRATCETKARKQYGPVKKAKGKAKKK
jgi:hypothetical protein